MSLTMGNSLYEARLQGIMVVAFIKPNIQSKMMKTATMTPCGHVPQREWTLLRIPRPLWDYYYGMFRRQIHTNLAPRHPLIAI